MADDKSNPGRPDRGRINLSEDYEVSYWCNKFGCTREELAQAVQQAGSGAKDVEGLLSRR